MINRPARLPLRVITINLFREDVIECQRRDINISNLVRELLHQYLLREKTKAVR